MIDETYVKKDKTLTHLPKRRPVNIEFQDLNYSVFDGGKSTKRILKGVNGNFVSGQLTAILGPSGAGKSSLLNILAGYKCIGATGTILVNGQKRNVDKFRKISRYIMQEDHVQPYLTVQESMMIAANLKLGRHETLENKEVMINEIVDLLRLNRCKNTRAIGLSGGEKKRLSIALELINNPPVIFLDEPTTGLDDVACSQCIGLLKLLAKGGRTVICAVHTPSARLFAIFDNVYILSDGQCVYQGYGPSVVPFLANLGLVCPTTYSPADFMIEVCSQEYGDFQSRMVSVVENGHYTLYTKEQTKIKEIDGIDEDENDEIDVNEKYVDITESGSTFFDQVLILTFRMWKQNWRDKSALLLKLIVSTSLALLIGLIYVGMGNDGSKTLFNFGFYYNCIIFFMYIPLMPVLLWFPLEIKILKREHFNKWYSLGSYYLALTIASIPIQLVMTSIYVSITYPLSGQPMELDRIAMFFFFCIITGFVAEALGFLIGAMFNIVNALFVGTCIKMPMLLLATYGFGAGAEVIPKWIRISMRFTYLRYSMEGVMSTMLKNREVIPCPENEDWCLYTDVSYFLRSMGMNDVKLWIDIMALFGFYVFFKATGFYILKQRLSPNRLSRSLEVLFKLVKSYLGP